MNKSRFPAFLNSSTLGALKIAGFYLLIGALWILFSDMIAERSPPIPSADDDQYLQGLGLHYCDFRPALLAHPAPYRGNTGG